VKVEKANDNVKVCSSEIFVLIETVHDF